MKNNLCLRILYVIMCIYIGYFKKMLTVKIHPKNISEIKMNPTFWQQNVAELCRLFLFLLRISAEHNGPKSNDTPKSFRKQ